MWVRKNVRMEKRTLFVIFYFGQNMQICWQFLFILRITWPNSVICTALQDRCGKNWILVVKKLFWTFSPTMNRRPSCGEDGKGRFIVRTIFGKKSQYSNSIPSIRSISRPNLGLWRNCYSFSSLHSVEMVGSMVWKIYMFVAPFVANRFK